MGQQLTLTAALDLDERTDDADGEKAGTGRVVFGRLAPYGQIAIVPGDSPSTVRRLRFERGAFARTIAERADKIRLYAEHVTTTMPLGRVAYLEERDDGLYGGFELAETSAGNDALTLVKSRAIDSFSVGFRVLRSHMEGGVEVVTEARLQEVSLVASPALEGAKVQGVLSAHPDLQVLLSRKPELVEALEHRRDDAPDNIDELIRLARRKPELLDSETWKNTLAGYGDENDMRALRGQRPIIPAARPEDIMNARYDAPNPFATPPLTLSREAADLLRRASYARMPMRLTTTEDPQHTLAAVTLPTIGVPSAELPEPMPAPVRRLVEFANMQSVDWQGVTQATFPVFGSGDASTAPEGALKAEYDNITSGNGTPQMIALWTDFTTQAQITHAGFEGRLRRALAARVARAEDELVISQILAMPGIQTLDHSAETGIEPVSSLLEAASMSTDSDVAAPADVVVVNPADVAAIWGAGLGTGGTPTQEYATLDLRIHGMRAYVSNKISAGQALVGCWSQSARVLWGMRPTYRTDPYTQMKNNIVTLLLEEAVGVAVEEPSGFVHVTFAGAGAPA
mgnify:CR=1 FL=1